MRSGPELLQLYVKNPPVRADQILVPEEPRIGLEPSRPGKVETPDPVPLEVYSM